jgi:hypothetical protein
MEATIAGSGASAGRARAVAEGPRFASAEELREVLEALLGSVDSDERAGTLFRAAAPRLRLEFTDRDLILNLAPGEGKGQSLRWRFGDDVDWEPRLRLWMDSTTANRYLQGAESLAIAIARGRVRFQGDSRTALLYVPTLRLLVDPYRRLVAERFPRLVVER